MITLQTEINKIKEEKERSLLKPQNKEQSAMIEKEFKDKLKQLEKCQKDLKSKEKEQIYVKKLLTDKEERMGKLSEEINKIKIQKLEMQHSHHQTLRIGFRVFQWGAFFTFI